MTKVMLDKYPLGSLPYQKTAGRYIDEPLKQNIDVLVDTIVNDMTYLGVAYSSTLEVGTGKSTFIQQIGEYYTYAMNEKHKTNLTFDMKNIVFKAKDLMTRAFELPRYSFIMLDEGDDLDAHYFSELARTLRTFFRKCRQLNLFIIVILPNFFQLPSGYAISRSIFAVDVRFEGKFERGFFSFYSFKKKKELYVKGKRFQDYGVTQPDFTGRFTMGYAVDEEEYRKAKYKDMQEDNNKDTISEKDMKKIKVQLFKQLHTNLNEISVKRLSEAFGISDRTAWRWLSEEDNEDIKISKEFKLPDGANETHYNNNVNKEPEQMMEVI